MCKISTDTLAIEQPKRRKLFYGYVVVFVSFLICMVGFGATYCFGIFFKPLLIEFGWTRSAISGAFSVNMVMQLVIGFFAGKLTDKIGPTKVITAVGIIGGLGFILMSKTHSIWQVYMYYGVFGGTLGAGTFVPALSTVGRWFAKSRGLMNGLVVAGIGMGIMVAPPLVQEMVDILNWRTALIVIGTTVLISILVSAHFLRSSPAEMGMIPLGAEETSKLKGNTGTGARGLSFLDSIKTRQYWIFAATWFFFNTCLMLVMLHIVPYATDKSIDPPLAASILSVIGGISIFSKITFGWLSDRIGVKKVVVVSFALLLGAFLLLLVSEHLWVLWAFGIVFGVGYGGYVSMEFPLAAELFGLKSVGAIFGFSTSIAGLGSALGPYMGGRIFDYTGSYDSAFMMCAGLCVLGLMLTLALKRADY